MATIEGKPASEWLKSAKERQAKGQFDETGAREAIQRMQGRSLQEYNSHGRMVVGGTSGAYRYQPPAKKPEAAVSKTAAKPAPARQVTAMPKPQDHASPAKPAAKPAAQAPKPAAPAPRQEARVETYAERAKRTGISKAVEDARKQYEALRRKNPPKPIAKPKEEMAKDIPAGKFWDEGHARAAVKEMKADEAREKAAERESYTSTKRKYSGITF